MTITLVENFRAVFYAPFYLAHALEAYRAEGLDVRLRTSDSPGPTAGRLAEGEVGVWWGGPMRLLVAHDEDPESDLVGFCEVVTRDPFFVVGRVPRPEFQMSDLMDLAVGTVSEVPTPWMCLQDDLRQAGLDPDLLNREPGRTMAENVAALRAGGLDAVQIFEPFVEQLVGEGTGHIWYAAASRGPTSYTTLYARRRTLADEAATAMAMTRALYRVQGWIKTRDAAAIGAALAGYFPDLEPDTLRACIARYKSLGIWGVDPFLPREGFDRLKQALLSGGLIQRGADYDRCIDTGFAEEVIEAEPPPL
jgi:NitT/TauT family transport system substrate-binding protein